MLDLLQFRCCLVPLTCCLITVVCGEFLGRVPDVVHRTGNQKFADCVSVHEAGYRSSGLYELSPPGGRGNHTVLAPCVLGDNYSYTVVQQRVDGRENFQRYWKEYVSGFGNASSNFWLGLDHLHSLTQYHDRYLQVNLQDWTLKTYYAFYPKVFVSDATDAYRLTLSGGHFGTAPDDLQYHSGQVFSTGDRPDSPHKCARYMLAGWWYNYCAYSLLNGRYYSGGHYPQPPSHYWDGMFWKDLYGYDYSMKFASMLVGKSNMTSST